MARGVGYQQAQAVRLGMRRIIASANTATPLRRDGFGTNYAPACFPFEAVAVFDSDGGACKCAFAMTSTLTFYGGMTTSGACALVDTATVGVVNGGRGAGACFSPDGRDKFPGHDNVRIAPGARTGVCSTTVMTPGRTRAYPPCNGSDAVLGAADCVDAGAAGPCRSLLTNTNAARDYKSHGCAPAVCQCDTANTAIDVSIEGGGS